jgi:hypothetical protein
MKIIMKIFITCFILNYSSVFTQTIIENFTGDNLITNDIVTTDNQVIIATSYNSSDTRPIQLYNFNNNRFELMTILTEDNSPLLVTSYTPQIQVSANGDLFISNEQSIFRKNADKWFEYKQFDNSTEGKIEYYIIDSDNYWATLSKKQGHNFLLSYISTFDNTNINVIDSSIYPKYMNKLYKTYNDMVITSCGVYGNDTINGKNDIYLFKDGKLFDTFKLPSANGKHEYKNINQIYTDEDENIWFCYTGKRYTDPNYDNTLSGVSVLKKNGGWVHFTDQDGYPRINDAFDAAKGITKFNDGWLVIFENDLIFINENFQIEDFSIVNFFDNSVFYKTTEMSSDYTIKFLNSLKNKEEGNKPQLIDIVSDSKGRVFITSNIGIFVYNNGVTSVEDHEFNHIIAYPNPINSSDEYLNIKSFSNTIETAEIVDVTGSSIKIYNWEVSGDATRFKLPIGLSSGIHYLVLKTSENSINIKFIVTK